MSLRALLLLACVLGGCRIDPVRTGPVDPLGTFEVQMTYGENGCFGDWPAEGTVLSAVQLTVSDAGDRLMGAIDGAVGVYIALVLGTRDLLGEVDRGHLVLRLDGRYSAELVGCAFVYGLDVDAIIAGDAIEGAVSFTRRLPDTDLCDPARCTSTLRFTGRRIPPVDAPLGDASSDAGTD